LIWIKAVGIEDGNCEKVTTRMKPSVIVWDLETVPDVGGFAAANDLVGKRDADIREALGNKFPKHIYHTIVCIGALVAHRENDRWAVDAGEGAPSGGVRRLFFAMYCERKTQLRATTASRINIA
jgi:hypothetical protein